MIGEVIRLLLLIYNMNKQQLNKDNVMTVTYTFLFDFCLIASYWREFLPNKADSS